MSMRTPGGSVPFRALAATIVSTLVGGLLAAVVLTAAPAAATTFSNPATITLPDPNCTDPDTAVPYPSNISVAGLSGTVTDVNVTLNGVTHPFEGDLEVFLVGPGGGAQNIVVLSDAGTGSLSNATVTFDDAAAALAPQNVAWGPGTYKPSNYTELGPGDNFPAPAPAPSANATFATAFNGIAPNGTWSLYVVDDACPDAGQIAGGWTLDVTTAASAVTSTSVTSSLNPSRTGDSVTFTATVTSSGSPVTSGTVTFTDGATTLAANVPVNLSGVAAFSISSLTEGNHLVTATYNGTASFATSSGQVNQRVDNDTVVTGSTYCNTGPLALPSNGIATPYPSNIFATSAPTNLAKVVVTLKNVTHAFDGDIEALLVGPAGQNLVVVSDAGTAGISNITVNFDDAAAAQLPAAGAWAAPNSTISAKPTNYSELVPDNYPPPAPAPSAATTLATFNSTNANGTWSLYVIDDAAPDSGSIAGGWCLTFTAALATPTISTQASAGGPVGTSVNDVATVSGGASPTGNVTFRLFSDAACTTQVFTSTNALGAGTATSGGFAPAAPGTYFWTAVYNGDANNNTVTSPCGAANESVVITQATPTISTQASAGGPVGTSVNDVATVSGGASPTGDVTFRLYSDAACTTQVFTSTNNLAGGSATSGSFPPAAPGTYFWTAVYNGDANNNTATSACGAANESVVIGLASPTISTQASTGGPLGTSVSDVATVSGGASPTGNVTFRLYSDAACTTEVFTSTNNLVGGSATSGSFPPATPGTYFWTAVYNGDANNNTATSACGAPNELVVIGKANPTIATQASAGGPPGTSVNDVATVSGGSSPTGDVTFRLFSDAACATEVFTSTNTLAGGSATSGSFPPAVAGTYFWTAVYNGDANNDTATSACGAPNESVTIVKASPTIATQASAGGVIGTSVTDTATVSDGSSPTGTVTFRLFTDAACTSQVFTTTSALGAGTATSSAFTPAIPGTYFWTAVYNGDANNDTATSPCGAANESVVITKASPTISTQASAGGPLGTAVTDTATVSGGSSPTGNVTFRLFTDAACTSQVFTTTSALGAGTATSSAFTPAVAGTYFWTAVYNGDANNNTATSPCGAPNESVLIGKASPSISTQASAGGPLGTSVNDVASLSGAFNPTGDVTFRLFTDAACTNQVFATTSALVGTSATSSSFTPAVPGTYFWTAVYNGDANNNTATSACGAPNESVTIAKAQPTMATTASPEVFQGGPVHDTATVSGGSNPTGDVTFRLFTDAVCTNQVFATTSALVDTSATSSSFTPAVAGTYFWTAVYNGDALNDPATSPCGAPNESVVVKPFVPPPCTLSLTGDVTGPIFVNAGQSVCVTNARLTGPLWVNPGGAITVTSSQITQGIVANAPSFLSVCGSQITSPRGFPSQGIVVFNAAVPLRIGDPANGCAGNRVVGDVSLTGNTAGLTLGANVGSRHMTVDNNTVGLVVVKANTTFGTLACSGNVPPPSNAGQPNTAASKTGQCAAL